MVHGLLLTPVDETKERVRLPVCACAGAAKTKAPSENSARPIICDFITMPSQTEPSRPPRHLHYCSEGAGSLCRPADWPQLSPCGKAATDSVIERSTNSRGA